MPCNNYRSSLLVTAILWQVSLSASGAYVTILNNGPSSNRIDMVFLGDGYTESQIDTVYADHVQSTIDNFFGGTEDPFPRYQNFFNVYRVDVISNESGADRPPDGIMRDTALDASYYYNSGPQELLFINKYKADAKLLESGLLDPQFSIEMRLVTVNDTLYGGGGSSSYAAFAGGSVSSWQIALHELGHSFAGLVDEYVVGSQTYTSYEPQAANVTTSSTGEKWSQWLGYTDPDHPEMGVIGAYEGAMVDYSHGVYRPSTSSKMRSVNRPFDAVGREEIILDIYSHVDPLDAALDNSTTLVDPTSLWVDTIDADVIQVQWFVDDELVTHATDEIFHPFNLSPGEHEIKARAYDDTPWVRRDLEQLEQWVTWNIDVNTVLEPFHGDANLDGIVDDEDAVILAANWQNDNADWFQGDFDGDGVVTDIDVTLLAVNWQRDITSMVSVPEPGMLVLLFAAWLIAVQRSRGRNRECL